MARAMDYLTDEQKERLGWVCEDDGFINDINLIINSVLQKKHLQECDPDILYPKN